MLDADLKPIARDDVQYSPLDDGAVIYDTGHERVHVLNSTAAYIWNLCDGSSTIKDIQAEIEQLAPASRWPVPRKVEEVLTYFEKEGLLRAG